MHIQHKSRISFLNSLKGSFGITEDGKSLFFLCFLEIDVLVQDFLNIKKLAGEALGYFTCINFELFFSYSFRKMKFTRTPPFLVERSISEGKEGKMVYGKNVTKILKFIFKFSSCHKKTCIH